MEDIKLLRTECQIFSRVCGWLVPRHAMNLGKQAEVKDRVWFDTNKAVQNVCEDCKD